MAASSATLVRLRTGELCWREILCSNSNEEYHLVFLYPTRFPYERVQAVIVYPELPENAPHRYFDDLRSLCLFGNHGDDVLATTAGVVRGRAALWILFFEHWCETGEWPNDWH